MYPVVFLCCCCWNLLYFCDICALLVCVCYNVRLPVLLLLLRNIAYIVYRGNVSELNYKLNMFAVLMSTSLTVIFHCYVRYVNAVYMYCKTLNFGALNFGVFAC